MSAITRRVRDAPITTPLVRGFRLEPPDETNYNSCIAFLWHFDAGKKKIPIRAQPCEGTGFPLSPLV